VRASDDWEDSMERFVINADTVERLLNGALNAEDAPHRFGEVAALLQAAALPTSGALDGEAVAVESVVDAIRSAPAAQPIPRRKTVLTKAKIAAAGLAGALSLTSGLAAANALPGAAQSVASDALAKIGVSVPSPNDHAGNHPNVRGKSGDHHDSTADANSDNPNKPTDNKGAEISNLARNTDATGADKGAVISNTASDGKSHAGEDHGQPATAGPPASTPAPTTTVPGPNNGANATADQHSGGASSAGAGNADSHRP
jgi:hypothetical protein